ncbi:Mercuric reductase [Trueperella bialowiezensis]|uniref:Mercuric reductase n=2 Tax=Trueperella bialowiezensis TaxID=312285 RepID=A0A448PEY3_9ACTO|nr:Mercuric reductase [Trueperella bialowiezensis]
MIKIYVDGMTCNNCVSHVTEELTAISGIDEVIVTLDADGTSTVEVVGEATDDQLREAIDEAGYDLVRIER